MLSSSLEVSPLASLHCVTQLTLSVVYIASNEFSTIAKNGVADVVMFNRDSFPLLVGTAVFAFEGVGL
jgi:proton-coupled amino acid transporter